MQVTDLVGQAKIVNVIKKQAEKNQFHHAYLFAGQFGSGKTWDDYRQVLEFTEDTFLSMIEDKKEAK